MCDHTIVRAGESYLQFVNARLQVPSSLPSTHHASKFETGRNLLVRHFSFFVLHLRFEIWILRLYRLDSIGIAGFSRDFRALHSEHPDTQIVFDSLSDTKYSKLDILSLMVNHIFPIIDWIQTTRKTLMEKAGSLLKTIVAEFVANSDRVGDQKPDDRSINGLLSSFYYYYFLSGIAANLDFQLKTRIPTQNLIYSLQMFFRRLMRSLCWSKREQHCQLSSGSNQVQLEPPASTNFNTVKKVLSKTPSKCVTPTKPQETPLPAHELHRRRTLRYWTTGEQPLWQSLALLLDWWAWNTVSFLYCIATVHNVHFAFTDCQCAIHTVTYITLSLL